MLRGGDDRGRSRFGPSVPTGGAALTEEKSSQASGTFTICVPPSDETITWRTVVPSFGRIVAAMKCVATCLSCTLSEAFSPGRGRNLSPVRTARYGVAGATVHGWRGVVRTDVPHAYVALSLRLRRLAPALVAPVAVDAATRRAVGNEPAPTAAELVRAGGAARGRVAGLGIGAAPRTLPGRAAGCARVAGAPAGRPAPPFRREVRECLGLRVEPGEPDAYRAAHRELAALLPGVGPTGKRLADSPPPRRRPARPLGPAVRSLSAALRDRVAPWSGPAAAGDVEYRLVDGAPWSALQAYAGDRRSVVRVNAAAALGASRLPRMVAHEAYPGHHLECSRGEAAVRAGRVELGVSLLGSPQTVVSEGLAECGLETAVGPGWGPWGAGVSRRRRRVASTVDSPSGSTRSWPCCGGCGRRRAVAARRRGAHQRADRRRRGASAVLAAARHRPRPARRRLPRPAAVAGARRGLRGGDGDRRQVRRAGARPRHATPSAARCPGRPNALRSRTCT